MIIDFDPTAMGRSLTLRELEAIATGKARVRSRYHNKGASKSYQLSEEEREIFEQTKVSGVIVDKKSAKVAWLAQWWLETTGQPCVRVQHRGKLAQVSMDLITSSREDGHLWTGTDDRPREYSPQHTYAAKRLAAREAHLRAASLLREDTKSFDQTSSRLLAQRTIRDFFDNVVRWNGCLWQYDGLHYEQISDKSLKYEVWPMFSLTNSQVNKVIREIIELLPELKGEAPQWVTPQAGDLDAKRFIVRSNEIFDIYEREAYPASPRLFVTGRGAQDLVRVLARAADASPRGGIHFGTYTSIERVPAANAVGLAQELRALYWTVIGKKPPA